MLHLVERKENARLLKIKHQ